MAFLLKINAARRLSGSEGRRAARFLFRATCYGLFLFACYGVKYRPVWPGTLVFWAFWPSPWRRISPPNLSTN